MQPAWITVQHSFDQLKSEKSVFRNWQSAPQPSCAVAAYVLATTGGRLVRQELAPIVLVEHSGSLARTQSHIELQVILSFGWQTVFSYWEFWHHSVSTVSACRWSRKSKAQVEILNFSDPNIISNNLALHWQVFTNICKTHTIQRIFRSLVWCRL